MENSEQNQSSSAAETPEQKQARLEAIVARISVIDSTLASQKSLYDEKDNLIDDIMKAVGVGSEVVVGDTIVKVVDNFAQKRVVFRQAGVRRFELEFDSVMARTEKLMKSASKGAKK